MKVFIWYQRNDTYRNDQVIVIAHNLLEARETWKNEAPEKIHHLVNPEPDAIRDAPISIQLMNQTLFRR